MSTRGPYETSPLPTEPRTLSERLRWLRKQQGLTQVELAQILGCEQAMVSSWEVGRTRPSSVTLGVLARHYGLAIASLDGGEDFTQEAERSLQAQRDARLLEQSPDGLTVTLRPAPQGLTLVDAASGTHTPTDSSQAMAELLKAVKKGKQAWVVVR